MAQTLPKPHVTANLLKQTLLNAEGHIAVYTCKEGLLSTARRYENPK
jgi:hypothetical protein